MQRFINYLLSRGYSDTTTEIITTSLIRFQCWCDAQNVEPESATYNELLGYMQHLHSYKLKQRTIQLHFGNLSHYFSWLTEDKVREDNPVKNIKIQGVQRQRLYHIIPMPELEALYEQIQGNEAYLSGNYQLWEEQSHHSQQMHRVMFGLVIWQGFGSGELANLKVKDLQLREGKVHIEGDRRSNARTLKLESVQVLDLMEYLNTTREYYRKVSRNQSDRVFINRQSGNRIESRITALMKLLHNLNPVVTQMQQLRTSVITHWLKNHNLRQVQYMAGHRYVSSTEKYLVNDLDDLQEDINRFHPLT